MHTVTDMAMSLPRVPPGLLSQPVHLLAGLRSLPSPLPIVGSELGSIVSHEGGDDGVVVLGAVLRVLAGVGPLLGLDLILEGDDLAREVIEASVRLCVPTFLLFVGESQAGMGSFLQRFSGIQTPLYLP